MGIPRLTSFVQKEFNGWRRDVIQGKLIIDGFSLCHALFDEHLVNHNVVFGGDYVSFAEYIEKFLMTLMHHKIESFVIFDGTDFDLKKKKTHDSRRLQDAATVTKLLYAPDTVRRDEHVMPLLSRHVMIHTIRSVVGDDHFYVADGDADVDVASYGISHKCPVLSADSDFYVFPLTHGYIPYSKFNWHDADKAGAIYGEVYYCELFAKQFGIADQCLLALLPAIVGNDTIPPLDQYMSKILPVGQKSSVHSIIRYAADFKTVEECKNTLLRQKIIDPTIPIHNLQRALQEYFISSQVDYGGLKTMLKYKNDSVLPEFVVQRIRTGTYSRLIADAVCLQEVDLKVAVEDMLSQNWCHLIGLPVRRVIYSILCGSGATIQEIQRHDKSSTEFSNRSVRALASITYHGNQIPLPSLVSLGSDHEIDSAKKILYTVLECREKDFKKLSKDYRLLLAIMRYWYTHCTVRGKTIILQSFLLYLQDPNNKVAITEKDRELDGKSGWLSMPSKAHFSLASFAHAVSQWQSLYNNVHCLNQLLREPLPLPEPSDFLECSNLYSYTIAVTKEGVTQALRQNGLDESAYSAFFDITHTVEEEAKHKMVMPTIATHTGSSRAPKNTSATSDGAYTCRNRFASLSID
ncbi:protein asteroid homolog 1-like [Dysidea avara]|uniref:protein asteroid homolog 1-like n=1 Tax=Dysidea avara TaxID=196820 RepID=UPI00332EB317